MASRNFLDNCGRTFSECTRLLSSDDQAVESIQHVITRMETMAATVRWARGRLVVPEVADEMLGLISELVQEAKNQQEQQQQQPVLPGFTVRQLRGQPGRPVYQITQEQLQMLLSFNFSAKQIADILGVSRSTVKRRLRQCNLSFRGRYTDLTDEALDNRVLEIVSANDEIGPEAVRARLVGEGIIVQRQRVRQSLIRTNPEGAALRTMSHRLHRRTYQVAGPNSLWHLDGNHKLIKWRIVIHGAIDGYSRLVVFLQASNNNRSNTVMDLFVEGISQYGVPSRVRCDHGGENNAVCLFMNVFRGSTRGSALRGRSTHNQRIERLWGDVWRGTTNIYHSLFTFLENEGKLNVNNEMHLWALHFVYMPRINRDLRLFMNQWNHHRLRTARYMSPYQIFVRGCLAQQLQHRTGIQGLFGADEQPLPEEQGAAAAEERGAAAAEERGAAAAEERGAAAAEERGAAAAEEQGAEEQGAAAAEEQGAAAAEEQGAEEQGAAAAEEQGAAAAEEQGAAAAEEQGAAAAEEQGAAAAEEQINEAPAFDWSETVQVPLNQFQPSDEQLEYLRHHINPLGGARDSLGTDIFEQVLNFLS